jgi:SOS response regulatory protein OraA/RecX
MTHPDFNQMTREELLAYLLEHRDDEEVFHAYMDRLATEPVLARGSAEDLQDPERFAAMLEKVRRIKQGFEPPEG